MSNELRKENIREILSAIYRYGPVSRAEIASRMGITIPAVTVNIPRLIEEGIITECGEESRALGRPSKLLDFIPDALYTVGVDCGPYMTYLTVSDIRGGVIAESENPLCPRDYGESVEYLVSLIEGIISSSGVDRKKIAGVGIGVPGLVDSKMGTVRRTAMSIYDWQNAPIATELSAKLSLPCLVDNNARCRATAVESFEQRQLPNIYAYLFVHRGISCPVRIGNNDFPGATSCAGEIGHMVMEADGPVCPACGNHGCLNAFSSEVAVLEKCGIEKISDLMAEIESGNGKVLEVMDGAIKYLSLALANMINLINPSLVLVEGYMMQSERNRENLIRKVKENLFALDINEVEIRFVEFKKYRTARGAAAKAVGKFIVERKPF